MKRQIPLLITFLTGVIMFIQFFIPAQASQDLLENALSWARIISMFALVLGVGSVLSLHGSKIIRKKKGWGYSIFAIVGLFVSAIAGIGWGLEEGTVADWIFQNIQIPIQSTMFSLLAFFIASAAYRAFRARSAIATALLLSATIVMLGRVPIADRFLHNIGINFFTFQGLTDWILNVPNLAAKRAITIGVGLGIVATSLKIILGIERSYLGGEK